jgi:hypothetical protein
VKKVIFQEIRKNIIMMTVQKIELLISNANYVDKAFSILAVSEESLEMRSPVLLESKNATSLLMIYSNTSCLRSFPILWVVKRKMNC